MGTTFDAIVLIAHGARDARWMDPFRTMQAEIAQRLTEQKVALAFMEFATPTFPDAVAEVCRAGARRVLVVPVFLSGGGHVANDVPQLINNERLRYPDVEFAIAGAIGEEREVVAGMIAAVMRLASR